jgi:hypothetical protein
MTTHNTQLTELEANLAAIAFADTPDGFRADMLEIIGDREFCECGGHDWQVFVDWGLRAIWPQLELSHKLVAYIGASQREREIDYD